MTYLFFKADKVCSEEMTDQKREDYQELFNKLTKTGPTTLAETSQHFHKDPNAMQLQLQLPVFKAFPLSFSAACFQIRSSMHGLL